MALTVAELKTAISTLFPDNTTESITEADIRLMFEHVVNKIEEARWVYLEDSLSSQSSYTSVGLQGFTEARLIVIVDGVEQSTKTGFTYDSVAGTVGFSAPKSGKIKIIIRPLLS